MENHGNEILELLSKFSFQTLSDEWIKAVIDADFTEVPDLPFNYEDAHSRTNFIGLFNGTKTALRHWIDSLPKDTGETDDEGGKRISFSFLSTTSICSDDVEKRDTYSHFWINLTKSFNINGIMGLLFYYIYKGLSYDAKEEDRELGILAAGLYLLLLAIPGSNAFRFFHSVLYLKSLDILKLTTKLNIGASPKKGGRGSKMGFRKSSDDSYGENDDEDADLAFLSQQEASKLMRSLNILLNDFLRFIDRFPLKHFPESLEETLSILVEVTRCEIHSSYDIFIGRHSPASSSALAYNAYVGLQNMCIPLHGNVNKIVRMIMKNVLNNILMNSRGSSDLSTRALGIIKDHSLVFVKYLLVQIKDVAYDGVYLLLQHLCFRVPDKAEFREKTAKAVVDILRCLPLTLHTRFLKWLFKFSHNEKAGHRLFALEVISKLIAEDERKSDVRMDSEMNITSESRESGAPDKENSSTNHEMSQQNNESVLSASSCQSVESIPTDHSAEAPDCNILSHNFLLSIIFSRCRDSAATVRSKALSLLAVCTLSTNPTLIRSIQRIFFKDRPTVFTTPHIEGNINSESVEDTDDNVHIDFPNAEKVMSMLRRRALDEKVTVRKSALQVIENLMKLDKDILSIKHLEVLVKHSRDPALLIRKQVVSSLTTILETYPEDERVMNKWVMGIMPLVLDPEMKVQERVIEVVDKLLFAQITPHRLEYEPLQKLPWGILQATAELSYHKFFTKILMMWAKSDFKRPRIVLCIRTHLGRTYNEQAWTLLALLSQHMPLDNPIFALDYFEDHCDAPQISSYTLQQVLKVLSHCIKHIPEDRSIHLKEKLLSHLANFNLSVELITPMMDVVTVITYTLDGEEENGQKSIEKWAIPILKSCDDYLKKMLFTSNAGGPLLKEEEELLYRHIFTLGEVSMLCPSKVNKRLFLLLQSIIFHEKYSSKDVSPDIPSTQTQSSQPPAVTFTPTSRLKSVAVVSLGKMCLQHENQAKRVVPALAKLLDITTLSELKTNVIFVLSDMCVRYATLVDPLMPQVTACLMDGNLQVRRTTLTLLINLLQEDYLKLKGSFFYRILQCLCDEHEDIKSTIVFYMTERLLKRFPKIFVQHFIECIFHYNCYEEHESYNRFVQSRKEKELFSLAGAEHRDKRFYIYRFMLEHMSDEQRFATTQRLCQDVLGGIVDGRIKLTSSSLPMLEDTLLVLSSEEIKLASLKTRPEDLDQPCDQMEQAQMAGIAIKKTIISQVLKRNVIENIVPILISLKHRLEEQRCPLMKQLLIYFKELMKDYKNEIKEILAGDQQLSKEIEFDLRKLEQKEEEERRLLKQQQEELKTHRAKSSVASLGNSPKLKGPPAAGEGADSSQDDSSSDQDVSSATAAGAPLPSPSFVRRKSDGNELLKKAMMNYKKVIDRQQSISTSEASPTSDGQPHFLKECRVTLKRLDLSTAPFEQQISNPHTGVLEPPEGGADHPLETSVDVSPPSPRAEEAPNTTTPASKPHHKLLSQTRAAACDELQRAISTPQRCAVIDNITFINKSQEISCIGFNATAAITEEPEDDDLSQSTTLFHFRSPALFAKDEEFSKLRRASKRCLSKEFYNSEEPPVGGEPPPPPSEDLKRPSGGFLDSYNTRHNILEDSDESGMESPKAALSSSAIGKTKNNKRNRDSAALSPLVSKTDADKIGAVAGGTPVKKVTPKRRRCKRVY